MNNITYSNPSNLITSPNTPVFQDWSPTNALQTYFWSNEFSLDIATFLTNIKIKDVIGLPENSIYSLFRLVANQEYGAGNPTNWLNPTCYTGIGYPNNTNAPIDITANGLNFNFTPVFQNLEILPNGVYNFLQHFIIQGKDSNNNWIAISSYTHTTRLSVSDELVSVSPFALNFMHYVGLAMPSKDINVDGLDWTIIGRQYFTLSSATPGITIQTITFGPVTYQKVIGSGPAVVTITLTSFWDTLGIATNLLHQTFQVLAGVAPAGYINIQIDIFEQQFLCAPATLNFVAVKNIQEAEKQYLNVISSDPDYTFTNSPWLQVAQELVEINGMFIPKLSVVPMLSTNMDVGIYSGFVKLAATVEGVPEEINIPVTYDLQDFVTSPFPPGEKAFTLDPKFFRFSTQFLGTYFQIKATIKTFNFFTNIENTYVVTEKLPMFQGKGELNYGQLIHRLMDKFTTVNENPFQYKPALLTLDIEEFYVIDNVSVRTTSLVNLPFVAGLSNGITGSFGFLDFNKKPNRVTKNSFFMLNMLVPNGSYELRIIKNGTPLPIEAAIPLPYANGIIISKKIFFSDFTIGDVIDYTIDIPLTDSINPPTKRFYVIPEARYSSHIIWENEFLVQSALELTGAWNIKSDLEFKSQTLYENLVEVLHHLENTKISKCTVNTGWLIKSDIDTIESLMRSKRAWLQLPNKDIQLRPISKSLINEDTERELIEYTIEFQINRTYNEETYS